ncbi:MAG: beta-propeller domain-containing protein [Lachnospiraceae bacterium]|nr:beta-propeller domain-containing protein [Lachnospiraceae bacterium]
MSKENQKEKVVNKKILSVLGLVLAIALITAAGLLLKNNLSKKNKDNTKKNDKEVVTVPKKDNKGTISIGEGTSEVLGASNREEVLKVIYNARENVSSGRRYGNEVDLATNGIAEDAVEEEKSQVPESPSMSGEGEGMGSGSDDTDDYYKNNDQVEGVKEADIVLTDGKNIFSVYRDKRVEITTADGENLSIASEIDLMADTENYYKTWMEPDENHLINIYDVKMFILGTQGIFLVDCCDYQKIHTENPNIYVYEEDEYIDYDDYYYDDYYYDYEYGKTYTVLFSYDFSNVNQPKLMNCQRVEGSYSSARMADDYLYLMTEKDMYYQIYSMKDEEIKESSSDFIPEINGEEIDSTHIYLPEEDTDLSGYMILTAFKADDTGLSLTDAEAILSDYSDLYMNQENIFTYSLYGCYHEEKYNNEDGVKMISSKTETQIMRFAYQNGQIEPKSRGIIDGRVLNQFCMDEYNGYLRLVSTVYHYDAPDYMAYEEDREKYGDEGYYFDDLRWEMLQKYYDSTEYNALYILDQDLNTCGSIKNIAENESIYSARFLGDKGYFVTFRQMDPLFEVDLSDVNNPVVTAELEMTGYSGYLHPWDDTTMLGIGEDATEQGQRIGFKMALYSIGEEEELTEITKYVLEGKSSYDSYEYKNMMIAPEKNFVGLNLSWTDIVTEDGRVYDDFSSIDDFYDYDWNYVYNEVYTLFSVKDRSIERVLDYRYEDYFNKDESEEQYYYSILYRGLYIGDYLYIVTSDYGISAVSLEDFQVKNTVAFH